MRGGCAESSLQELQSLLPQLESLHLSGSSFGKAVGVKDVFRHFGHVSDQQFTKKSLDRLKSSEESNPPK